MPKHAIGINHFYKIKLQKKHLEAGKVAQQVKEFGLQARQSEFCFWNPRCKKRTDFGKLSFNVHMHAVALSILCTIQ